MRLIYNNLADIATITASSTSSGSTSNLQNNRKSSVHRASTSVTYTLTWATPHIINSVALPATNLVAGSNITVNLYATTGSGTPHTQQTAISAALDRNPIMPGNVTALDYTHFSRGGATKTSIWFPTITTQTTQKVEIILTNSTSIDCSRIVCGKYWEPKRDVSRGITLGIQDTSETSRTRTGDTYINTTYVTESMNFELQYFSDTDRKQLLDIFRTWGSNNYVYISVFPDNTNTEMTRSYSIYGRSSDISLSYDIANFYTTSLSIESW
jgi:hypothetical protein